MIREKFTREVYHPFFSEHIKHGDAQIILKKAGINATQLGNWKNCINSPRCDMIKWIIEAIADHYKKDFNTLLVEYFKTV